ncbi:ABC-2 type transport system permease protein [Haloactinopolyspora alba]|uniref:ABC-2 type transport system permease protein n=1 Tax=Haloactinopolyspora alba TaxID=648780 RepID=A0A2P8E748_9ACTN|nr:ABC transporter permease [Haloactinopolyspora alba]PSL05290.1 ABC-2 type transport system permease protein [Haloactinopolyspora alba]
MSQLTGTTTILRLNVRRDRVRLALWVAGLAGLVLATASGIKELYPTRADLQAYAETAGSSPAAIALNGPAHAVDTTGGAAVFEVGGYAAVAVALMSILLVGRSTRAEEESGRTELLRAGILGRHAGLAAAVVVAVGANLLIGAVVAGGFVALGLPTAGSLTFGASLCAVGVVFAGVASVTVQLTEHARTANAMAGAVVGVAYVVRAAGDVGESGLSWLSPFGWAQATRPFASERWWPLLLVVAASGLLLTTAVVLQRRRDVGAGLVPQRPGPARAAPGLLRQVGFSLRLQRGALLGWTVGVFAGGAAFGSVGDEMDDIVADSDGLQDWIGAYGGNPTDAFLALTLLMLALGAAGCTLTSALRLSTEESAGRVEPLLATPVSRPRWMLSHLVAPLLAGVVVPLAGGLGVGVAYATLTQDPAQVPRMLGAALAHVPAVWALTGLAVLLIGAVPRAVALVWAVFGGCVVAALLGSLIRLPDWVLELSPFAHTPRLPGESVQAAPLVLLTGLAVLTVAAGVAMFRRRDLR